MSRLWIAAAVAAAVVASTHAQAQPSAEALAKSLQQRYDKVRDFSASFVHTYRGGMLRKQATERGVMSVKKPGKMRWDYSAPEKKHFVSDGVKLYSYVPQDRQVIVASIPSEDEATTAVMFLAGKGNMTRDFTASYPEGAAPAAAPAGTVLTGTVALKLVPRRAEQDYDVLILFLDPATLQIRGLTTTDRQGGESTFAFSNLKENQGLSDKEFAFRIPRGVDVITDGNPSR
jgi:outer membrane lipoprotein carrier protein